MILPARLTLTAAINMAIGQAAKITLDKQTKISYNMSMTALQDPTFHKLPDPVIFRDWEGRVTGQMSKAEILEKDLVLVYSRYGPCETKTAEESRREDEEWVANGGLMPWQIEWQELRRKERAKKASANAQK